MQLVIISGRAGAGKTTAMHQLEDEVFFVLSGRGVLRYGEDVRPIRAGDCISCPAGTKIAHQIYNPHEEDLVYLAIGAFDPHDVCLYPDSGRVGVEGADAAPLGHAHVVDAQAAAARRHRGRQLLDVRAIVLTEGALVLGDLVKVDHVGWNLAWHGWTVNRRTHLRTRELTSRSSVT